MQSQLGKERAGVYGSSPIETRLHWYIFVLLTRSSLLEFRVFSGLSALTAHQRYGYAATEPGSFSLRIMDLSKEWTRCFALSVADQKQLPRKTRATEILC
jgi:hypothetical protein